MAVPCQAGLSFPACRAAAARVLERVAGRFEHRGPAATDQLGPGSREPRLGESELVAGAREDGSCLLGDREQVGARASAVAVLTGRLRGYPRAQETRTQLADFIPGRGGAGRRVVRRLAGSTEISGQDALPHIEKALECGDHMRVELELGEPGLELSHDLDDRQIGDPIAVRDAAAANHGRPVQRRQELVREP